MSIDSLADLYPQVHVTAVTLRDHPIYPATTVGRMPAERIFHNLVFVSMGEQYPGLTREWPHTVFALLFALVWVTIASYVKQVAMMQVAWVTVAFAAARGLPPCDSIA